MSQFDQESKDCEACNENSKRLSEQETVKKLSELSGWAILEKNGIPQLTKNYRFKNFVTAENFARKVGKLAEEFGHHPAILLEWGSVTLYWWSHKIQGLHEVDFKMAEACDKLST